MNTVETESRKIEWGPCLVLAAGGALLFVGAARFYINGGFGISTALYCCLAVIPAALLLLVFDYVLHHARLVAVMPLLLALALIVSSPVFDVAIGFALMGAVVGPLINERRKGQ
jgi:TM2 domain-containing membrane protein YozV